MRNYIKPCCEIVAYVLMPNHFHLLIAADERTEKLCTKGAMTINALSEGIRMMLSSYTKAINKQEGFTGNLIQQKTRSKCILDMQTNVPNVNYAEWCLHYIHQNPLKAGLVDSLSDWKYSSYLDYAGLRNGTLCNRAKGLEILDATSANFISISNKVIPEMVIRDIFE